MQTNSPNIVLLKETMGDDKSVEKKSQVCVQVLAVYGFIFEGKIRWTSGGIKSTLLLRFMDIGDVNLLWVLIF